MNDLRPIIEGILFVSGDEGVSLSQLSEVLVINEDSLVELMDSYMTDYNSDESKGLEMLCYGKRYKLVTKAIAHSYCQKLFEETSGKQFSQAALETLAIIAYKQPVTRVEIEEIRGVSCDMMIRKLLARNLIKEVGRLDTIGKPFLYEVTEDFMDTFSLTSLSELPELPEYQTVSEEGELFY
ncbi:MAG TPA: SMC-Scp complex subunit ScpB [Erysipelotrichaceae bacterium]|jgi:segregation and condensation protein B|nr:SMC-Scp complex subunit ScpB [Erysipelotrichia bacterium]HPX33047.1 SMC-Scp complex subunit ScpB [Erysipelotrichaceae bacterium]HQA85706.1 SMC-Scp complex subunit ScpB [Erysipelotrichaceae bacterium]